MAIIMSKYTYCNCDNGLEAKHVKPYRLVHSKDGQCTLCAHYVVNTSEPIESKMLVEYLKGDIKERQHYLTTNVTRVTNRRQRGK